MLFAGRPFGIIVGTARRNVYLISLVLSARPKNGRSATRPHPNRSRWGGRTIAKYVLAADFTLMTDYRNVPLATFFSCIPTDQWQSRLVFRILANAPKVDEQGRPVRVPYGLRKIEASLVQAKGRDSVVIADPRNVEQELGIDHIVHGEVDHLVPEIFERIAGGDAPPVMRFTNATAPTIDQIPKILGPTMHGMNEVMRGCGRGCEFCEVTLRRPRYFPLDYIGDEIAMNTADGQSSIQLHSDDILLYKLENWKTMEPNEDAVKDLFRFVMEHPGVCHCYPTHGTASAAVTNPGLIADL